jgi:hypothetical protein
VIILLKYWNTHDEYKAFLISKLKNCFFYSELEIIKLSKSISKLYILDLDPLGNIVTHLYSSTGRPAINQDAIMRSFILMNSLGYYSITKWYRELHFNHLYCYIIGVEPSNIPSIGAHYDFINRFWCADDSYDKPKLLNFYRKPKKKYKKNEKKPPKSKETVKKLVSQILKGRSLKRRPERIFQSIFAKIAVEPSANLGLLKNTNKLSISGDGTCIETGAGSRGVKVCSCKDNGIYNCKCKRRFSDPNATWGWDSHHERWFYGYSGFIFSVYNKSLKLDLPIYLRVVEAKRHDSSSAVIALTELKEIYSNFTFKHFIGDSAFDNKPTYELLNKWFIVAIIALNKRAEANFKYHQPILNDNGIPVCQAGHEMKAYGACPGRGRYKWRCPFATGLVSHCDLKSECSPSEYGRTFYTKFLDDLRLFPEVPRGTYKWKSLMKSRTSSERVNKRILNDYSIEQTKFRGKKGCSWWMLIASINIHLDAQIKHAKFNFVIDPLQLISKTLAA